MSSFALKIVQEPEAWHPTIQVQFLLHEGDRLFFVLGVERTAQAALQLIEDELLRRDFDAELTHCTLLARVDRRLCQLLLYPYAFRKAFLFRLATMLPRLLLRSQPGGSATLVAKKVLRTFFI